MVVDLHCHPLMKPFGHGFKDGGPQGRSGRKTSIWHRDRSDLFEKLANYIATITKFTQADMTSLAKGNVRVVCVSLYALEKGFVHTTVGSGDMADQLVKLPSSLTKARIDHLQRMPDYFTDLEQEYAYLCGQQSSSGLIDGHRWHYRVARNMAEVDAILAGDPLTIAVIPSIEGAHVFNCGLQLMGKVADEQELLRNIAKVKAWEHPPFFMTFAHHFNNELCGHAQSFDKAPQTWLLRQHDGMGQGFSALGWKVLESMLSNTNGKRIHIDIKHMSPLARREYLTYLRSREEAIPAIVSHGAVNGCAAYDNPVHRIQSTRSYFNTSGVNPLGNGKPPVSINFYDDELIAIAESQGIIGLQMDERRIASKEELKAAGGKTSRRQILYYRSKLVWNQVQHVAEVLDEQGLSAWDITALGTDYDGIIDPLNGYWTAEDLNDLDDYLLMHAQNYLRVRGNTLKQPFNKHIDPELLVDKVMNLNAMGFLRRWYT